MLKLKPQITPPLTIKDFLTYTKLNLETTKQILNNKNNFYGYFEKPKKKGGTRSITPSKGQLKLIQRSTKNFLDGCLVWPFYMQGGIRNRSVLTNARWHTKKSMVVNVDIENCFPNTFSEKITEALCNVGFDSESAILLTEICTYKDNLPQGAPTSTCIANIVLESVDRKLYKQFKRYKFSYTRFVDDITVSGNTDLRPFKNIFYDEIMSAKYTISQYSVRDKSRPQIVTGLIVNDKIRPTRQFIKQLKDDIRAGWPEYGTIDIVASEYGFSIRELRNNIIGRINFLRSIDNKLGRKIHGFLAKVEWPKENGMN